MAEDDKIRYRDIIEPDDSIEKLVKQLGEVNRQYEVMVNAIRAGADRIVHALKSVSGATSEGRKSIDEAAASASRLERAQNELKLAMSDTGKQIAWLKAQTVDQNKATVEQQRYIRQAITSYDRLKSDLKEAVGLYKSLTQAEREDANTGKVLLQDIINLKNQIKALDDQMKPHIAALSEVQKAEQKLAFLQSAEGQRLLDLKNKIAEVTAASRGQKAAIDPLVQAHEKLAFANSKENEQLKLYAVLTRETNRIAELNAKIKSSQEGSYNRLSAQYELNKIKLNAMSAAERSATDSGKKLEEETRAIYEQMKKLQEATGNYKLSVGNYERAWNGLGISISQVIRELPSLAISANTFFLAISNNIPMVADEIQRLREKNKALIAEGKPAVSLTKEIIKSLFSFNTVIVLVVTALSLFGKQIIEWVGSLFKGKAAVISLKDALKNIGKELENTNASYGNNVVKFRQLSEEWKKLKSVAEQTQWIKDNQSEFNQLGFAIDGVNMAEKVFSENTELIIEAMRHRAKAAAAQKLAAEQYEKALIAQNKAEQEGVGTIDQKTGDFIVSAKAKKKMAEDAEFAKKSGQTYASSVTGNTGGAVYTSGTAGKVQRAKNLADEATAANKTADAYFKLAEGYLAADKAAMKAAGAGEVHKTDKARAGARGRKPRDLTDTINKNQIKLEREYEESVTKLRKDEFAKRRKAAADQVQDENNKLREMYRKNEEYINNVDGKYKELTEDQKEQIAQQQKWIIDTIANNLQQLEYQTKMILREQQVNSGKIMRESLNGMDEYNWQASAAAHEGKPTVTTEMAVVQDPRAIEQSLIKERRLVEEHLKLEYDLIYKANEKLREQGDEHARSEEEILTEFNKKRLELWSKYDKQILDLRKKNIEDQLALVKKGSDEELKLLLQKLEIERQLALAANAAKPASEQVSSDVINAQYDKSKSLAVGEFNMEAFDQRQAREEAEFSIVKRSEDEITLFKLQQEKDRWEKLIAYAKAGALDWSDEQVRAAEATVKGIEEKIKDLNDPINIIAKYGLGGGILHMLGFNDEQVDAFMQATNIVIDQLKNILAAEVELAEQAVAAAEKRVDAAQKAYDAEIEARNNGYANDVATAKKELEAEKKNQQEKQKILADAQRRQQAIDTVTQTSSLITASANIWASFSKMGIVGPILAAAAIASMFTSFAVSKIKARQVANATQEYGEGGLEFLEGGSHASGNDIDLGVTNKKKRRMRAEGGEALAIINKRRTRKYKKILPDVVESLNKGTFEDKYLNAFAGADGMNISLNNNARVDLSKIEEDVRNIRQQSETICYTLPDGSVVMQRRNIKRIIKS